MHDSRTSQAILALKKLGTQLECISIESGQLNELLDTTNYINQKERDVLNKLVRFEAVDLVE